MDIDGMTRRMRDWYRRGREEGHGYLLVWQDAMDAVDEDMGLYPQFVPDRAAARAALASRSGDAQRLMEIIDLDRDLLEQLREEPRRTLDA